MTEIKELRQRAMKDPQSLSKAEWDAIFQDAFGSPKKEFTEEASLNSEPVKKQKQWW